MCSTPTTVEGELRPSAGAGAADPEDEARPGSGPAALSGYGAPPERRLLLRVRDPESPGGVRPLLIGLLMAALALVLAVAVAVANSPELTFLYFPLLLAYGAFLVPTGGQLLPALVVAVAAVCVAGPADLSIRVVEAAALALVAVLGQVAGQGIRAERANFARTAELVSQISGTLESRSVLRIVVRTAAEALNVKAASVRLLAPDEQTLEIVATHGLSRAYLGKGQVSVKHSTIDRRVLRGEVVAVRDVSTDPRFQYPEEAKREGIASVLCVPLRLKGKPTGVLRVYTARPRRFRDAETRLLLSFATDAALVIQHAERHQQALGYLRKAAHELRSPLSAVRGLVNVIAEGFAGDIADEQRRMLQRATRRIDLLLETVADILALSRLNMTAPDAELELLSLPTLARSAVELRSGDAHSKGVRLDFRAPDGEARVLACRQDIDELLGNLLSNAIKYTPSGGEVHVELEARQGTLYLAVRDTGIGIPEEDLPAIGEEFKRAANARGSDIPGTGLGMSIVRSIVQRHHGNLTIQSRLGEGTEVRVGLPLADGRKAVVAEKTGTEGA